MNKMTLKDMVVVSILTGAALIGGGKYMQARNSPPLPGADQSVQVYLKLEGDIDGGFSVRNVLGEPAKYSRLTELYDEMTSDSEFMVKVEAEKTRRAAHFDGFKLKALGAAPLFLGAGGCILGGIARFQNRRRGHKEREQ